MGTNNNSINRIEVDFVKYYLFLKDDVGLCISIEEAKEAYTDLNNNGYCKIEEYYVYNNEEAMEDLAKEELDTKLGDADEVASMFNIEVISDMWINKTSKEMVAKEYLSDNGWVEVLKCEEPTEGYIDSNGETVFYCYSRGGNN